MAMKVFAAIPSALLIIIIVILPIATANGADATAADDATSIFSFSGFGTLGSVHSSENKADFTSSSFKPDGAGFSHRWSPDVDSRVGAQVTADITAQLSAVVQVLAEQGYDNTYTPVIEWANLKYQVTPDMSIRVGRIVQPSTLVSDHRKVGYSYPWLRPPVEVVDLSPTSHSDGVDVSFRSKAGAIINTLQGNYGRTNAKLVGGGTARAPDTWGITDTLEYGFLTLRFTYQQANVTVDSINVVFDAFRQFGPQGVALAEKYGFYGKSFVFKEIGGIYDPGAWFVMAEWDATDSHAVIGVKEAWYASGGYRLRNVTPYVTYSQVKVLSNRSDPGLDTATLPPFLEQPAGQLNAALNAILQSIGEQKTTSVGARWDFMNNAAFKVQYDHIRLGSGSAGLLTNVQPGFERGGSLDVFSASIDFVF